MKGSEGMKMDVDEALPRSLVEEMCDALTSLDRLDVGSAVSFPQKDDVFLSVTGVCGCSVPAILSEILVMKPDNLEGDPGAGRESGLTGNSRRVGVAGGT